MKRFGRRSILQALAASPVAGHVAAEHLKLSVAGLGAGAANGANDAALPAPGSGPAKFSDFGSWLKKVGEREIRRNAQHVNRLDPDLVEMRLPLVTKFRMQRERNYKRELEERREWFERRLSMEGVVEWWL